ncbi:unnamed protein product [Clonostachys rosea]|uniref:Uncharacterized protein n=1 Tax=Bionectria ochroleuca TaxID=29856 RepID=A0ABY6UQ60_BIOOC|nr:unnamed protein product [Clonostachys rosea]
MERSFITVQVAPWIEILHAFLDAMEDFINYFPQVSYWLGASGLYLPTKEELLNHQHHDMASIMLAAILATLILAQVARWLETSGVYHSYNESLFKGTSTLLRAIYALFSWSTLYSLFSDYETDHERERRLLDNCAGNDLLPPRRSNSTCRRVDPPRKRLRRFKEQWKENSFPSSRPPWVREQRLAWEKNVYELYMEALVHDHDALEGELAERDASLESLREEMFELKLRIDQNRNWYCKIWNMYKPGDVVQKAPMSLAKTALRQTDMWEDMYRRNLARLQDEVQTLNLQLEKMMEGEKALKRQIAQFSVEREEYRKERQKDQALISDLKREFEERLKQVQVEVQDEERAEDVSTEESLEDDEDEDERQIAQFSRRLTHKTSNDSIGLGSTQLSEELKDADLNDDDMPLSWN